MRCRRSLRDVPEMLAGIGTILTTDQVQAVSRAGAAFGVAPGTNPKVIRAAQEAGLPFAPGIVTPSDVEAALELGCRELKFFPAEPSGGVPYLKSLAAPYAHLGISYVPLGGVNAGNLQAYLAEPSILAVGGSWLATRNLIQQQDWATISGNAREASEIVRRVRGGSSDMKVMTFGEIMGRMAAPGFLRLRQALPGLVGRHVCRRRGQRGGVVGDVRSG